MKKYLMLDTNIIFNDFFLTDPEIKTVSRLSLTLDLHLCLPKVIFQEIINKYKYLLNLEVNKARTAINQINKRFHVPLDSQYIDIERSVSEYQGFLSRLFHSPNTLLDFPKTSHESLTMKGIQRRKPFKDNGSGYRDALIWENIKELLQKGDQVYFVTKNSKDFFEEENLHSDLLKELDENKIDRAKFSIFSDVKTFF